MENWTYDSANRSLAQGGDGLIRVFLTIPYSDSLPKKPKMYTSGSYFFLPPALSATSVCSHEMTLPNITTPLPSMKATRERPSQFLKVSQTRGCCGAKEHSAISFDFKECGSSIFLPPVSLPIFQESFTIRQADRPHRTKPIGE